MKRYICFRPEEHICEHETGAYVLFADAQAAIEAREEIAENLRGEIRDISAESAKFEIQATQLRSPDRVFNGQHTAPELRPVSCWYSPS